MKRNLRATNIVLGAIACLLLCYTVRRAAVLSISHDEAMGYFYIFRHGIDRIITFAFASSNNHLLNSLLTRLSVVAFGESEFAMRLPNLAAHLLYLAASYLFVRHLIRRSLRIPAFLLLNLNPFLLDFFGLSRGYGLACSFTMISLYCAGRMFSGNLENDRFYSGALWGGFFAVLSNFSFLTFYLALLAVTGSARVYLKAQRNGWLKTMGSPRLLYKVILGENMLAVRNALVLAAVVAGPIVKLIMAKELYYGGKVGFVHDTVQSLVKACLYDITVSDNILTILSWSVVALSGALVIHAIYRFIVDRNESLPVGLAALLGMCALIIILQHILIGTKFTLQRSALYFFPSFMALLCAFADSFVGKTDENKTNKPISVIVLSVLMMLIVLPGLFSLNFSHQLYSKYDSDVPKMLNSLKADARGRIRDRRVKLGINWLFEPIVNFYIATERIGWLQPVNRSGLDADFDYYYYLPKDAETMKKHSIQVIDKYSVTKSVLARRK